MKKFIIFAVIACFVIGTVVFAWQVTIGSEGPVIEVSKAGEVICEIDGAKFVKLNDGVATVGLYHNENGALVPLLISEDEAAVSYKEVSTGKTVGAMPYTKKIGNKKYYYSDPSRIERYVEGWQSSSDLPIYYTDSNEPIKDILSSKRAATDGGWLSHIIKNYWYWPLVVAGVVFLIIKVKPLISSGSSDDDYSYGGSSSGMSSADIKRTLDDIEETRIMNNITKNINTPGYDPDSFGPPSDL